MSCTYMVARDRSNWHRWTRDLLEQEKINKLSYWIGRDCPETKRLKSNSLYQLTKPDTTVENSTTARLCIVTVWCQWRGRVRWTSQRCGSSHYKKLLMPTQTFCSWEPDWRRLKSYADDVRVSSTTTRWNHSRSSLARSRIISSQVKPYRRPEFKLASSFPSKLSPVFAFKSLPNRISIGIRSLWLLAQAQCSGILIMNAYYIHTYIAYCAHAQACFYMSIKKERAYIP